MIFVPDQFHPRYRRVLLARAIGTMDILSKNSNFGKILPTIRHLAIVAAPIILVAILFTSTNRYIPVPWEPAGRSSVIADPVMSPQRECITNTLTTLKLQEIGFAEYEKVWALCGNEIYNTLYLHDFKIRREKFIRQELDERVTLWMVVAITMSGVVMSGLQLLLSYRLALSGRDEFDKDIEISIQKDRIALKSSVVGLVILVISLAFFVVYVKWIYTITEVSADAPASRNVQVSGRQLPMNGTLGAALRSQGSVSERPSPTTTEIGSAMPNPLVSE